MEILTCLVLIVLAAVGVALAMFFTSPMTVGSAVVTVLCALFGILSVSRSPRR